MTKFILVPVRGPPTANAEKILLHVDRIRSIETDPEPSADGKTAILLDNDVRIAVNLTLDEVCAELRRCQIRVALWTR